MLGIGEAPEHPDLFWATTIVYGLSNLGYMASGAQRFLSPGVQRGVFLFDVLVVSALIVMRGVDVPEFILAYFTLVLMAAVVQGVGERGAQRARRLHDLRGRLALGRRSGGAARLPGARPVRVLLHRLRCS